MQRLSDSATSVNGHSLTTGNYIYKDQPTCQNGQAIKVIWSCFVDIPNGSGFFVVDSRKPYVDCRYGQAMTEEMTASPKKYYISQLCNSHNVSGRTFAPWNYGLFASKTIRSREQKSKGAKVPRSKSSRVRKFQEVKVPRSKSSRE